MKSGKKKSTFPTLGMIAEKAEVSRETVSHILGGKLSSRYRHETRVKVLEIAEQLKYRPHRGAQAMKSGRSNLVAIVHFGAGIEAAHKTNLTLARMVSEQGYDYLAMDMNWYGGSMERTLEEIIRARVEGVLVSHIQEVFEDDHVAVLRRAGIPVVSVNGTRRRNMPLMCSNTTKAFEALTRHLLKCGHRRIVQLVNSLAGVDPARNPGASGRIGGFRSAIEEAGRWVEVEEKEFFAAEWPRVLREGSDGGILGVTVAQDPRLYARVDKPVYHFCSRLFPEGNLPDAIVSPNDFYAMEIIAAGLEFGVNVPGDLAVTGYDNDRIGEYPAFGLTTAEQDIEGICSSAMDVLMKQIARPGAPVADQLFDSRIIVRSSCGSGIGARRRRSAADKAEDGQGPRAGSGLR